MRGDLGGDRSSGARACKSDNTCLCFFSGFSFCRGRKGTILEPRAFTVKGVVGTLSF
jgi:hypothetical protein